MGIENKNEIAFIICANNQQELGECIFYINQLEVPKKYNIDIITIAEAESMAAGYNAGMKASNAKYKIYLHQDVFCIKPDFLSELLEIFQADEKIGLLGCIGTSQLSVNAFPSADWDVGRLWQNQIPQSINYPWKSVKEYCEVDAVDGLILATQYDLPWREELFTGWDFYDISQCYEFHRAGKKVVVPRQKECWCYHDNAYSNMLRYDWFRAIFIKEYQDVFSFYMEENRDIDRIKEYENLKVTLSGRIGDMLDQGEITLLQEMFQDKNNSGYLFLREYELIIKIYNAEAQHNNIFTIWEPGISKDEAECRLRELKHQIKRIEYKHHVDFSIFNKYSIYAVMEVIDCYCTQKDWVLAQLKNT